MIFTFYSYKGGVGRSMALANLATWFYQRGLRVVIVDWDLEAPGIESFFCESDAELRKLRACTGLIDLLWSYKRGFSKLPLSAAPESQMPGSEPVAADSGEVAQQLRALLPPLSHSLQPLIAPSAPEQRAAVYLLPAGFRAEAHFRSYAESVQRFDWTDFYASYQGEGFFEWLRSELSDSADVVLIDSRTGVSEMGGVCTRQLPDAVVCMCAPNAQNLEGLNTMVASFNREDVVARRGRRLEVVLVPSRVDNQNSELKLAFQDQFERELAAYTPRVFTLLQSDFWKLRIPYVSDYSFRERRAIGGVSPDPDLVEAYERLCVHLVMLAAPGSALRRACQADVTRFFGRVLPEVAVASAPDGSDIAASVERLLKESGISIWPVPTQTHESELLRTLAQTRSVVLCLPLGGLQTGWVKRIWREARRLGVRVLPVATSEVAAAFEARDAIRTTEDLDAAPSWMRQATRFSLSEPDALLQALRGHTFPLRAPFMAPELPEHFVEREEELARVKSALAGSTKSIAALWGPAGIGKSGLAAALCHDDSIRDIYNDGVLWRSLGPNPDLRAHLRALLAAFGEDTLDMSVEHSRQQLARLLRGGRTLLVLEDVCRARDAHELLEGLTFSDVLVTTRDRDVAFGLYAELIELGELSSQQVKTMIDKLLPFDATSATDITSQTVQVFGATPLAVEIVSQQLRKRMVTQGENAQAAIAGVTQAVAQHASASLLDGNVRERLERAFAALEPELYARIMRLAELPDAKLSLPEIAAHWDVQQVDAERSVSRLVDVALVTRDPSGAIALHALVRAFLSLQRPPTPQPTAADRPVAQPPGPAAGPKSVVTETEVFHPKSPLPASAHRARTGLSRWLFEPSAATALLIVCMVVAGGASVWMYKSKLPQPSVHTQLTDAADALAAAGNPLQAAEAYTSALAIEPSAPLYVKRGRSYAVTGRPKQAESDYDKALLLDPENADAFMGRAQLKLESGDTDAALDDLSHAEALAPGNPEVWLRRGAVFERRGAQKEALAAYSKAVQLRPDAADAYLARSALNLASGDLGAAARDAERALKLPGVPDSVRAELEQRWLTPRPELNAEHNARVIFKIADSNKAFAQELAAKVKDLGFRVEGIEDVTPNVREPERQSAEVRYYFKADAEDALQIADVVGAAWSAASGTKKSVTPQRMAAEEQKPGTIEIVVPTFAAVVPRKRGAHKGASDLLREMQLR